MVYNQKTVHINDNDELARLLEEADGHPVLLEKGGVTYRLSREDDAVTRAYDPVAVRDAVRAASGTLTSEEGEELKAYLYRARQEGSRPANRP
jgi:hypothetical protein